MFVEIALAAVKRFGVSIKQAHLDGSSMCVQGEYLNDQLETNSTEMGPEEPSSGHQDSAKAEAEENAEPAPIEITHGYSRDYRPDLKQFTLALITSGDGDVPLYLRVGNGNDADQAVFTEVIAQFRASVESRSTGSLCSRCRPLHRGEPRSVRSHSLD